MTYQSQFSLKCCAFFIGNFTADFGGSTHHERSLRHFHSFRHQRAGRDDGIRPDLCSIQNDRSDADESAIRHFAAVQNSTVTYRHTIPDDAGIGSMVNVKDAIVLNAGLIAYADVVDIASDRHIGPNARAVANNHIADHLGARVDVSGVCNAGHYSAIGSNHENYRARGGNAVPMLSF